MISFKFIEVGLMVRIVTKFDVEYIVYWLNIILLKLNNQVVVHDATWVGILRSCPTYPSALPCT